MDSSSTSPKFIPELLLWPLEILIKVKFVLSSFDSTAEMARVALPPVKRPPRYAVGSRKITLAVYVQSQNVPESKRPKLKCAKSKRPKSKRPILFIGL